MTQGEKYKYSEYKPFYRKLRKARAMLNYQQYTALKGQADSGDIEGATKGLLKIIKRYIDE